MSLLGKLVFTALVAFHVLGSFCSPSQARGAASRTDLIRWSMFSPATLQDSLPTENNKNDLSLTPRFFTTRLEEQDSQGRLIKRYQSQASIGFDVTWKHRWNQKISSEIFGSSAWTHFGQSQEGRLENHSTVAFGFGGRAAYRPWRYTRLALQLANQQEILIRQEAIGPTLDKALLPSVGGALEQIFFTSGKMELLGSLRARKLFDDGHGLGAEVLASFLEPQWTIAVGFFFDRMLLSTGDRRYHREDGGLKLAFVWNLETVESQ